MSMEEPVKCPNVLWWIASIATSVMCCALLFIFFASYMAELRTTAQGSNVRINAIEERETQILHELELIRKQAEGPATAAPVAQAPDANAPVSIVPPETSDAAKTPLVQMPHIEVPVVAPPALEKK